MARLRKSPLANFFFNNANGWFTDGATGDVTGLPGLIAALVIFAVVGWVVLQPTRRFHKIVTYLTILGIFGWALMTICGLLFFDQAAFAANLPRFANGITVDQSVNVYVTGNNQVTEYPQGGEAQPPGRSGA